jgi:uncharacterized membrane protein YgdD (TMEM256/DUF423 family)
LADVDRALLVLGAMSAFAAVGLGAFGAHALSSRLTPERAVTFETGVRYQLVHALGLFVVVFLRTIGPDAVSESVAGLLFVAGTVLFSGSLYVLALTGVRRWGIVTPFGGICLLIGWLALGWAAATVTFRFA